MKLFIIINFLALFACQSIQDKPSAKEIPGRYHTLKKGETLDLIAKSYQCDKDELIDVNGILDSRSLRTGQILFIPDKDPIARTINKASGNKLAAEKKPNEVKKIHQDPKRIMQFPIPGAKIVREFSRAKKNPYDGIGIDAKKGTKVLAALSGKVLFVGDEGTRYGLIVILEHEAPFITVYTHLDRSLVKIGQQISQGSPIALVGTSGGLRYPHLHFQLRMDQRPKDPRPFFKNW